MPASAEFRKSTLELLRSTVNNPEYKIEKKMIKNANGSVVTRYAFLSEDGVVWSIRKAETDTGSHPVSIAINGKSLWGEFLDSEVEALYKLVEKSYNAKREPKKVEVIKGEEPRPSSLGEEKEKSILKFLGQYIK